MNRGVLVFLGGWLLVLGGCVMSERPLSAMQEARPDTRLVGRWHEKDGTAPKAGTKREPHDVVALEVSFDPRGLGQAVAVQRDGTVQPEPTRFFVTRTARNAFLNVQYHDNGSHLLYRFYKYRVAKNGRSVQLWSLRADPFDAAIKAGALRGKLDAEDRGDGHDGGLIYTRLQDSSERILHFLESKPEKEIFEESITVEKVEGDHRFSPRPNR